ncbi:MAG TPA: cofactor-independent phosphoglycerate mutase [Acidimicrobiia bacterium]|nr:cofactor-independent phosphoglycerate mutase [Acidimicrobiia bacterium]
MKYVVLVPDGASDEPVAELGGRTPLEAAAMPNLAALAARGEVGRAATIPDGFPPGSDVGNMSILGYDPARYHTGRAPIEAAAMGIELADDEVAFRCNLVTVGADGTMLDFSAGHIPSEQSHPIVEAVDRALGGDGIRFVPGVMYRHIMVAPRELADVECVPPHDLSDQPIVAPSGPAAARIAELMEASKAVVQAEAERLGAEATQIWLWGQGARPQMPAFSERHGVGGALVTAVDLIRGLGVLTGIEVIEVEGATGYYDTNYEGKRDACLKALEDRDFFLLHVEASDEAGHNGDLEAKVEALENWDRRIIGPLVDALPRPFRILLLPDHPTPVRRKTHTSDAVPYLLFDSEVDGPGGEYSESATAGAAPVVGHTLMERLVARG